MEMKAGMNHPYWLDTLSKIDLNMISDINFKKIK